MAHDTERHIHNHYYIPNNEILNILGQLRTEIAILNTKTSKIMADLTQIEQEVAEAKTAQQSAVILLQSLKQKLDEAGTDPVKLKALSDDLSASTDALAAAVVANTPSEGEEPPVEPV